LSTVPRPPYLTLISNNGQRPILLVDDEPQLLRALKRQLARWGYAVVTVDAGFRALDLCKNLNPCLVITDLRMPDMDGSELLQRLRAEYGTQAPPMAVLTGDTSRRRLPGLPWVESILFKPAPPPRLRALVDGLCVDHRKTPYIVPATTSKTTEPDDHPEPPHPEPPLVA
jgi:CheY-like chemotaxis protein